MLLASPVDLEPGTEETACVRRAGRRQLRQLPSLLAETLGLEQYALGAVAPESVTLALLVVDRTGPPVSAEERSAVDAFATLLGICLENLVLRQRIADLSQEIREFAGVAQALAREALEAPATIEDRYQHHGPARSASPAGERPRGVDAISRLTAGERRIALLLAHGRTNREIATELVVSAETVKSHVANILRKLGAANRVEAASLLLRDD